MKIILSNWKIAHVDWQDYKYISKWKWHQHGTGYAIRRVGNPGKIIWMHRVINKTPEDMQTDHINRDRLDNRRKNLRSVTRSENIINSKVRSDNTSGYKGVYWLKEKSRWLAAICKDGKLIKIGTFRDKDEARMAREGAESSLYRDTTRT